LEALLSNIAIRVNTSIYLKDPESNDFGKNILVGVIDMIDEIGFEDFTFKKLAKEIEFAEAFVYQYFEGKHKLLLYIISWYWSWIEYKLVFGLANIDSAEARLYKNFNWRDKKGWKFWAYKMKLH